MPLRIIEIVTTEELGERLKEVVNKLKVIDSWRFVDDITHKMKISFLVPLEDTQMVLDVLQSTFGERENTRILVSSVEATLPEFKKEPESIATKHDLSKHDLPLENLSKMSSKTVKEQDKWPKGVSREELYNDVVENTVLNFNFILLVLLSTLVATIGLIKGHTTVLIGAMLITPLLGPNLALALSSVLADFKLMINAVKANVVGVGLAILFSYLIGLFWHYSFHGTRFVVHINMGWDSIVLALASGAAAVLSLVSGLSDILIGVMVATALLPPACLTGIMLSLNHYQYALAAFLLLIVNIVCINLAANVVFFLKGIHPYHWYEQQKAKKAVFFNITFFILALIILGFVTLYFV